VPAIAVFDVAVLLVVFSVVVSVEAFFLAQPSSIATIAITVSVQTPNRIQVDFVIVNLL
jgi:hypothetical protein